MANTANDAVLAAVAYDDAVIFMSASGTQTITRGDWILASASWALNGGSGAIGSPAYRVSALGIALENNPTYNSVGVAVNNSGFSIARRGVMRVSAGNSGTARTIPVGTYVFPQGTGSGIVGQTGRTGVGVSWLTAPPVSISGNPTGAMASGVAIVIAHPVGGDSGIGQLDIVFNLATNAPWL
jgi:hypothetical protein